jgi:hypothetical protein
MLLGATLPTRAQDLSAPATDRVGVDQQIDELEIRPANQFGDDRAVAVHAGGAVVLAVPSDWEIREVPFRREVRLTLAPRLPTDTQPPLDGMWLAYHYQSRVPRDAAALAAFATERLRSVIGSEAVARDAPAAMTVAGTEALRIDFDKKTENGDTQRGFYLLVASDWGDCEVVAAAPDEQWEIRGREFAEIVDSLQLNEPDVRRPPAAAHIHDAEPILGSWKSYCGLLRLSAEGRISIVSDSPFRYAAEDGTTHSASEIAGRFRANQDLLFIEWDDGSKLNFRWRGQSQRLLLTDHNGRMTQLRRVLE